MRAKSTRPRPASAGERLQPARCEPEAAVLDVRRHDPGQEAPRRRDGLLEHGQEVHRVQADAHRAARLEAGRLERPKDLERRELEVRLQGQDDAEVAEDGRLGAERPGHVVEQVFGRRGVVAPAHQPARARPDGPGAQKRGLLGGPAVRSGDAPRRARGRIAGKVLASAPFEIEIVLPRVIAQLGQKPLIGRLRGRLRELDAPGVVEHRPVEQLEWVELQGLEAVAVDPDLESLHVASILQF